MVTVTGALLVAAAFGCGVILIVKGARGMARNFKAENPGKPHKESK
jgi:hypothetical protein